MRNRSVSMPQCALLMCVALSNAVFCQGQDIIPARHIVTLPEAHIGDLSVDTKLLDSYLPVQENVRQFYFDARTVFSSNCGADFCAPEILAAAETHHILLMGGPLLGNLKKDGLTIWLRPATTAPLVVKVVRQEGGDEKSYVRDTVAAGVEQQIVIAGLVADADYLYTVFADSQKIASGSFRTAPDPDAESVFRLAFGSCFHKTGLHNPNLINQIVSRKPHAVALLGDIAADDRENNIGMHRSDYLLRDISVPWKQLAANVAIYAAWDDHDYLNNDLSGVPEKFTPADRQALRQVWSLNWNNPANNGEGIYFNTRIGPVELIMLDTRSCRNIASRGQSGSYLGFGQQAWLKQTLINSTAPFKVISSGTMWSDYISNGKDSWGTWDTLARKEIFSLIESEKIAGVLLISGDRHGARGFAVPGVYGHTFYEFEAASLGGVPGPNAMASDSACQLFGYHGTEAIAFGEFTFDTRESRRMVTFRLIDQFGKVLEEYIFAYGRDQMLSPLE